MKYVCEICGYVYDPANGDPDNGGSLIGSKTTGELERGQQEVVQQDFMVPALKFTCGFGAN